MKKMEQDLRETIFLILTLSEEEDTEKTKSRYWEAASLFAFYRAEGRCPFTAEERERGWAHLQRGLEQVRNVLKELPPSVLGEKVDWEKVCRGELTPEQKKNLQAYYNSNK